MILAGGYLMWSAAGLEASKLRQGRTLYTKYCASCHGYNLEGQPNWKETKADGRLPAPPHSDAGHTWHHSDEQLFEITKFGVSAIVPGYESDMLGFGKTLTDDQIEKVIKYIKSTWSEQNRDYQAERTRFKQ